MLISICPHNLEIDEGEAYVETRMREIGIMIDVITSDFVQHVDEEVQHIYEEDTEPSHFTHRVIVANIPTLEKFFEAVATFERDGYVDIESYGNDYEKWEYQGVELVDKSHEKYYRLPCLNVEVRGSVYY